MIRFAKPTDHTRLKQLWADVFGDTPAAIHAYFDTRHADENMLVFEQNNNIAGMLSMIPVTLAAPGQTNYTARYIYAVATDVPYRRSGISTALLQAAHAHMQSMQIAASILVPATASLFAFYAKQNYAPLFTLDRITLQADQLPAVPLAAKTSVCSAADYTRIRNQAFQNSCLFVRWNTADVRYAMQTFSDQGGVTALSWKNGAGCAAWERTAQGILVRELALLQGDVETAVSVLHTQLQARHYILRLAGGTLPNAVIQPFGMIHWLIAQPELKGTAPYLSLAMD